MNIKENDSDQAVYTNDVQDVIVHCEYVSNMAYLLGKKLNLDEQTVKELAIAGYLHDVGKLRLLGYIYGNESKSVLDQMARVRTHPKYSYDIIKGKGYSKFIEDAVYHHHENYDGTGYPDNLRGEDIPLGARVLRICDVFIALTSDRPYRMAFDKEAALALMIEEVKNFDMKIFLVFQTLIHEIDIDKDVRRKMYVSV